LGPAKPGVVGHARRRGELSRAVRPEHQDPDAQRSATTPRQVEILRKLDIAEPARFYDFKLPSPVA
jgi:hypothetical protein